MNQFMNMNQQYQPYSYSRQNNGITWVQGIEGAKAFQLMPNSNSVLMDSENDGVFYIKVSDNVGMCNLRVFNYVEVTGQAQQKQEVDMSQYVTKSELEEMLKNIGGKQNGKQPIQSNKPTIK